MSLPTCPCCSAPASPRISSRALCCTAWCMWVSWPKVCVALQGGAAGGNCWEKTWTHVYTLRAYGLPWSIALYSAGASTQNLGTEESASAPVEELAHSIAYTMQTLAIYRLSLLATSPAPYALFRNVAIAPHTCSVLCVTCALCSPVNFGAAISSQISQAFLCWSNPPTNDTPNQPIVYEHC